MGATNLISMGSSILTIVIIWGYPTITVEANLIMGATLILCFEILIPWGVATHLTKDLPTLQTVLGIIPMGHMGVARCIV